MKIKLINTALIVLSAIVLYGCSTSEKKADSEQVTGKTSSFAEVTSLSSVPVQGYGLVAGLAGTGSGQCPQQIRNYLKRYILTKLPKDSTVTADELLDSPNTAAVKIKGVLPANALKGDKFDLVVTPVAGTQTTSLAGGRLYTSNLTFISGRKSIATGQGPVFVDMVGVPDLTRGYVLGGGTVSESYDVALALFKPDFRTANLIRNRISERFGDDTVNRSSASIIHIRIPPKYARQKARFLAVLKELYFNEPAEQESARATQAIADLGSHDKGFAAELSLEAIGRSQENKIAQAMTAQTPEAKFRAARCLLFMGNDQGLGILRQTSIDPNSPYRLEAIEAIATGARRNDAVAILKQFLSQSDFKVRLFTYEQLRVLDEPSISTVGVAQDFEIDQVFTPGPKAIYVYRSGKPRIVLFSAPLIANPDIFIESVDGTVILNSPKGSSSIDVVRKHPTRGSVLGPIKASFDVLDIIGTLSSPPTGDPAKTVRLGLGLPYADTIAILKNMCQKGAINAEFVAGPLPEFK